MPDPQPDVLRSGPDHPRWGLVAAAVAAVVAAAVVAATVVISGRGAEPGPAGPPTGVVRSRVTSFAPVPAEHAVALVFDGVGPGVMLTLRDRAAGRGPWVAVVRRGDGHLGRNGAVVTYPVPAFRGGWAVPVGRAVGRAAPGSLVWPVAGGHARIRSDLPRPDMVRLAARTSVVRGRPVVDVPAGYRVVWAGAHRPPVVREARYPCAELGVDPGPGAGLVFTGVLRGGGFEDEMYARAPAGAGSVLGDVRGRPARLTSIVGGGAAVTWELAPGVVAYVGYSGVNPDPAAVGTLLELAARARAIDVTQWGATQSREVTVVDPLG